MTGLRRWLRRLREVFTRDRLEREMDEELRFHVAMEAEELERLEGLDPKEARRRALVAFGGVEQTKERARQVRRVRWLEDLARDLRQGVRSMRRAPGFTVAAVLTLALGIGATTAIFSVVNAVLLRPLPYEAPDRLVRVWESHPERSERNIVSPGNFMDWREQATVFDELAAHGNVFELGLTGGGEPLRVSATRITPAAFSALGVRALHGRVFPREEDPGAGTTVLMAHGLWRSRYGGDPDIIGRTVMLNERAATVIGVLPPGFDFPSDQVDFWLPLRFGEADRQIRDSYRWRVFGRLEPGVTIERAQAEMTAVADRIRERHPAVMEGWSARVVPFRADMVREVRPLLLVLMSVVAGVLLIGSANVANLLLARTMARDRELAIRGALGAGRGRIARQLLTETGVLAMVGGVAGFALAAVGLDTLIATAPGDIPLLDETRIDGAVFGFATGATLLSTLLAGLVPALRTGDVAAKAAARMRRGATETMRHGRIRTGMLVAEIALSLVLLVGAGLLVRSFIALHRVDYGFEPEGLLAVSLDLPSARYAGTADHERFYGELIERIEALPGVTAAAGTPEPPIVGDNNTFSFIVEGRAGSGPGEREDPVEVRPVTPGYLRTMGIPLRRGRGLEPSDGPNSPRVAVVNDALADRLWPGGGAIGRRIGFGEPGDDDGWVEVVGVAGGTRHYGLDRPVEPAIYLPYSQKPFDWMSWITLMVRTEAEPAALAPVVRRTVWALDDRLPIRRVSAVAELYGESHARRRFAMILVGAFAVLALGLVVIGIYGVVAYTVARQRKEIGVRLALGARRRAVAAAVVRRGLLIALGGVLIGGPAALGLTRLMSGLLYGIAPTDPVTFGGVALVLAGVAALASYVPARRATRTDPMTVLREE